MIKFCKCFRLSARYLRRNTKASSTNGYRSSLQSPICSVSLWFIVLLFAKKNYCHKSNNALNKNKNTD